MWGNPANVSTGNIDAAGDSPAAARADLKAALDEVRVMCNGRGIANGVAALDAAGMVPLTQFEANVFSRRAEYYGAGVYNWTVPAGIYNAAFYAQGPAGSGAYRNDGNFGGGGGGGGCQVGVFAVQPGWVFTITIAAAGAAPAANNPGNAAAGECVIQGPVGSGIILRGGPGQGGGIVGNLNVPGPGGGNGIGGPTLSNESMNGGDGDFGGNPYKTRGGGSKFGPPMWVGNGAPGVGGGGGSTGAGVAAQAGSQGMALIRY